MQSARIWFRQAEASLTLADVKRILETLGAKVEETEWRLGDYVVPQLRITEPVVFLTQLEEQEWVIEEAEEFSQRAPSEIQRKLAVCNARLACGSADDYKTAETEQGLVVAAGWTTFDPAEPEARRLLERLATAVNGIFEDNVNGHLWAATSAPLAAKRSILQSLLWWRR